MYATHHMTAMASDDVQLPSIIDFTSYGNIILNYILHEHCVCYSMGRPNIFSNEVVLFSYTTVSYTHLDVYKRQGPCSGNIEILKEECAEYVHDSEVCKNTMK